MLRLESIGAVAKMTRPPSSTSTQQWRWLLPAKKAVGQVFVVLACGFIVSVTSLQPGILLRTLDLITAEDSSRQTPSADIQRRIDSSVSSFDYDKAYEDFVRRYFSAARNDQLALDDSDDDDGDGDDDIDGHDGAADNYGEERNYSGEHLHSSENNSDDVESQASLASRSASAERCRKVRRNHQKCVICRNPYNNEKSETCSYTTESEPERYSYEKEKSYRKHTDGDDGEDEASEERRQATDDDDESGGDEQRGRRHRKTAKRKKAMAPTADTVANSSGSCTKRDLGRKVCYYCEDSIGQRTAQCFFKDNGHGRRQENEKRLRRSQKKLFKRTISYAYKNGTGFDDVTAASMSPVSSHRATI